MGFPDPSNRGIDPGDFSGRDAALGRYYFGGGDDDGGGDAGCLESCLFFLAILVIPSILLTLGLEFLFWIMGYA